MLIQHFSHTNVWGHKFDLAFKRSKVNLQPSFEQTVELESPTLHTKIQHQSFLGSGEEDFIKSFYHISAWRPFNGVEPFEQIINILLTEWCKTIQTNCQYSFDRMPHVKTGEICSSAFREEDL